MSRRVNAIPLTLALVATSSPLTAGPQPENDLEKAFYEMGIIGYCGLSTEQVNAGFQREVAHIVKREGIEEEGIVSARNRALTLVELEWSNRGLGGFRGWCRTEGQAAVERFLAVPEYGSAKSGSV